MRKIGLIIFSVFCILSSVTAQGDIQLSDVLQDNMVIQQNQPLRIKGTAKPNSLVEIQVSWAKNPFYERSDEAGRFMQLVDVPLAVPGDFTAQSILIRNEKDRLELVNILIGDVWFLSGQSNMQFSLKEAVGGQEELIGLNKDRIRLFNAQLNFSDVPIEKVSGRWNACDSATAENFSAVGYFFGNRLFNELNTPIGLIFSGIGASKAQAFVPKAYLERDAELDRLYLQPYLTSEKAKEVIDGGFSFEKVTRPYLLYNAMINPFADFSIKGVCWYQGEGNHTEREAFTRLTQVLFQSWRDKFKQPNMPFYYVQIAPYGHENKSDMNLVDAYFREAQEKIGSLNNAFMVSTMDVGDPIDLHPKNKKEIGVRLARAALNRTYNQLDVPYFGPIMRDVTFGEQEAWVSFVSASISSGLTTKDGNAPKYFYLAGEDQRFYPATATIIGDRIQVRTSSVNKPVALRYAFINDPVTNLQNGDQIPALPFRTDDWGESN